MKMNRIAQIAVASALALAATAGQAQIVTHEDNDGQAFRTSRGAGSAPAGLLTVSSAQTIAGFGIDVDLNGDSSLTYLIFNADNGALLYQSAAKAFTDTGAGYKYSDAFSFTFGTGTTYSLSAVASNGGSYFVDFTPNTVGAFNFLIGNQNVSGSTLDTSTNCCDVGTALVLGTPGAVPEPATWAMMIGGFGLVGGAMRRRSTTLAYA